MVVSLKTFNTLFKLNNYDPVKFESLAEEVIAANKTISELQFAPQGIIKMTYPHSLVNSAVGHNLNRLKKRKQGVSLSIKSRTFTLIGPVKLIQNNKLSFILRLPIFNDNLDFSGFVIAISDIVSAQLSSEALLGLIYWEVPGHKIGEIILWSTGW